MSRFARDGKVFFIEEPVYTRAWQGLRVSSPLESLSVITPHLFSDLSLAEQDRRTSLMLWEFLVTNRVDEFISWYYSPMALSYTSALCPVLTVYDCMDELSLFKFAPPELKQRETELMEMADVVFTGGHTLFDYKKSQHHNIYAFPSSIDKNHFMAARQALPDPEDQRSISHPRFGFYGVLDERVNFDLVNEVAMLRPDWQLILIGPIAKIDPDKLPKRNNIHYLGVKDYRDLPLYLSGWDVAMMPFALNDSTKYISPTKTPEYLAGGKPVISTSISDVVNDYGKFNLVRIADTAEEFVREGDDLLSSATDSENWLAALDAHLADNSWDNTWSQMAEIMTKTMNNNSIKTKAI